MNPSWSPLPITDPRLDDGPPDPSFDPAVWVWPGVLRANRLTVLHAEPAAGATTLVAYLAAAATGGQALPDGEMVDDRHARGVMIVNGEDDPDDSLRPKLRSAAAESSRVAVVSQGPPSGAVRPSLNLSAHLPWVLDEAGRKGVKLLVFDPWQSLVRGPGRRQLDVLANAAKAMRVAVLVVSRLRRDGRPAVEYPAAPHLELVGTSGPGEDPPTAALSMKRDPAGPRDRPWSWGFAVVPDDRSVRVVWNDRPFSVGPAVRAAGKRQEAAAWLKAFLRPGPQPALAVEAAAAEAGVSPGTLRRAKAAAGVRTRQRPNREGWEWYDPDAGAGDGRDGTAEPVIG